MVASKMISFTRIKDGERGFDGPYIYPIGEFNPSIIVTRDELSTPFVTFGGEYYLLNAMKSKQGLTPALSVAANDKTWILMDGFEYVFIKTAYIKYGQMGSFVFYNEYMFSKHGMIGESSSLEFTQFPNGPFKPNLVLNGLTGKLIANNAEITGYVNAKEGEIGGFKIGEYRLTSESNGGSWDQEGDYEGYMTLSRNFFRVGSSKSMIYTGAGLYPPSEGGGRAATLRVFNRTNVDVNYGIHIEQLNLTDKYGLMSESSCLAPAFISSLFSVIDFIGSLYTRMDYSKYNMFYLNPTSNTSMRLADYNDMEHTFRTIYPGGLPSNFGVVFTVFNVVDHRITIVDLVNHNGDTTNYGMGAGDSIKLLAYIKVVNEKKTIIYQTLNVHS